MSEQLGFYFNATRCSGCSACRVACKNVNKLPVGEDFRHVNSYVTGTYPDVAMYHIAMSCNHCTDPACVNSCPTGAMYKDSETGLVLHDDEACIGCESCVKSCPYGEPVLIQELGIVHKCDACAGLRAQGENPACVAACPMRAVEFGNIEELRQKHADKELSSDAAAVPPSSTTEPNIIFAIKDCLKDEDFDQIIL